MAEPVTASLSLPLSAAAQRRWMVKEPAPQRLLSPSLLSSITLSWIFCHFFCLWSSSYSFSPSLSICCQPLSPSFFGIFVRMNVSYFRSLQTVFPCHPLSLCPSPPLSSRAFKNDYRGCKTTYLSLYLSVLFYSQLVAVWAGFKPGNTDKLYYELNVLPAGQTNFYHCKTLETVKRWYFFFSTITHFPLFS